jgi:hypothetical protein
LDGNTIFWITGIGGFVVGATLRVYRNRASGIERTGIRKPVRLEQPSVELGQSTPLPPFKFCINCDAKLSADSKFCTKCGSKQL